MEFAFVSVPAAPVRRKPAHSKEMVNQLLFGEAVRILGTKGDLWVRVQSLHDLYEGWITSSMLTPIDEKTANSKIDFTTRDLLSEITMEGSSVNITPGASLPGWNGGKGLLGKLAYDFNGNIIERDKQVPSSALVTSISRAWLNVPYLWGGRTILGADCSGFVQVVCKMMGIDLLRDASQQALEGKPVPKFKERIAGDLAFFESKGSITHVGILLENEQIIHSSGKVKIDHLDKKGIVDMVTGKRIQKLECIRRYW